MTRVLVAGWFSFEGMNATAGDLLARDVACAWLARGGYAHDVAGTGQEPGTVGYYDVEPSAYTHLVFVCGPFRDTELCNELLARFSNCHLVGLDLSMLTEGWNPFDLLIERDSHDTVRPDLAFAARSPIVPVVGLLLVHPQPQYGKLARHAAAEDAITRLLSSRELAVVPIDTRIEGNPQGLRTPAEIESLIAAMDAVVTTRLHGLVLALKNGVPALAVDPIAGGAKVAKQAAVVGWPAALRVEEATGEALSRAFDYCLSKEARRTAAGCAARARGLLDAVEQEFLDGLQALSKRG
ncbi:MAG: polysaccharide pyruvyl transferase family protein [Gaiellaceae bacterium]